MRKIAFVFTFCLSLAASADESPSYWSYHPWHIGGNSIGVANADISGNINTKDASGQLYFFKNNAYTDILIPITHTSYFFPRVEWNMVGLDWNRNEKFNQNRFYYMQFGLTFYSIGLEDWRWIARVDYNLDLEHFDSPGRYGLFNVLVWGVYQPHKKWHVHVGTLGYKGLEGQEVYPVIGADFAPNKKWLFQIVFPINYSVEYNLSRRWRISAKIRPLKERLRTGSHEPQPRSILSYSSTGAELNIHYDLPRKLEFELFGGCNLGGSFYIKNQFGQNAIYTDVGIAPYGGASLNFGF